MKRILLAAVAVSLLIGAFVLSGGQKPVSNDLQVEVQDRNPWTHLRLNAAPETFHFAVVSDRTGGHRARIFSQAVEQLNLMQPAFVVSVGDLIEGYTKDTARIAAEWKEFQTYVHRLQMPFFYVPGNHDVTNEVQVKDWKERFGRRYYHFLYRDVLFLAACSDDPGEDPAKLEGRMSQEQTDYFRKVLKENTDVRWTIVCVHKPLWSQANVDKNGWLELEQALAGRKYTVFAGHVHHYRKFVRQGMNYYQLATTGGGSKMRGTRYGEFDHIAWVTMKKDGPVIANLLLDGILPEDLKRPITEEEGIPVYNRKPPVLVRGKALIDGSPAAGATVTFHALDAKDPKDLKKTVRTSDAIVEADGTFELSTYKAYDGAPAGEYAVTVTLSEPAFDSATGRAGPNRYPAKYATPAVTNLRVNVGPGPTELTLELKR
jgi:predicted phosphodiesterase